MNDNASFSRRSSITIHLAADEKRRFAVLAKSRGQSESEVGLAVIRLLLDMNDTRPPLAPASPLKESASDRITIRLRPGDRCAIAARAKVRGIKASTYIAALVRAHVATNPPLAADELTAFKQAVVILSKVGLLLARWTKGGGQGSAPPSDLQQDLGRTRAVIAALEQRMHDFVRAALVSWESHHD